MAISLITVYPVDTGGEDETLRQLATAVVATAFNDYMMGRLHPAYVNQVDTARHCLAQYLADGGEDYFQTAMRLMDGCFFRRVQWMRKRILRNSDEQTILDAISKMEEIVQEESRRTDYRRHYDSAIRFFHSNLYGLFTNEMLDLDTALRRCDEQIEKEMERIR